MTRMKSAEKIWEVRWKRRRALAGSNVSKPLALDNVSKVVRAGLFSNGGV